MDQPFRIIELDAARAKAEAERPADPPHRHRYEELILVTEGNPVHFIDFKQEVLQAPCFVYVPMGKVHQFHADIHSRGWAIRYLNEFIPEAPFHFYNNFLGFTSIALPRDGCLERFYTVCRMMKAESEQPQPDLNIIRPLLQAFMAMVDNERKRNMPVKEEGPRQAQLIACNNFLKILEANFRRAEGVGFYAEKMNTSVRNLNLITTNVMGKSVSELIESRKLIEARQLLLNTDKTISEIGYELGYNEKSYFSRVFHKKTGMTPSDYKSAVLAMIA
jgi:AraC family transcriptional regulator, transcriptional activator of pobA